MRVFGCARKIYFPEIIWSWPGKWAFDHGNGLKLKFSLQTISRLERERGSPNHAFDVAGEPRAPVRRSHAPDLADRTAPIAPRITQTAALRRSISPQLNLVSARSHLRPTDLSLWFWFLLLLWWCGSGVLVVVAFNCRSLLLWVELEFWWCVVLGFGYDLFRGLGFGCDFEIFCNKICLDAEKIVEKMWKICRKIAFSE